MLKLKRIALLLAELLAEVVLLGCFLGAMVSDKIGPLKGVLGAMITIPVVLGLHGYYVSRLLTTIAWSSKAKWLYPGLVSTAFVAHVLFIAQFKSDLSPRAQSLILPFLIAGTCIVFACSFAGNQLYRKWARDVVRPALPKADPALPHEADNLDGIGRRKPN
jgi:hypothetical protein